MVAVVDCKNHFLSKTWFTMVSEVQQLKQMQVKYFFKEKPTHMQNVVRFVFEVDQKWSTVFRFTITTKDPHTGKETTFTNEGICNPLGQFPEATTQSGHDMHHQVISLSDYRKWGKDDKEAV